MDAGADCVGGRRLQETTTHSSILRRRFFKNDDDNLGPQHKYNTQFTQVSLITTKNETMTVAQTLLRTLTSPKVVAAQSYLGTRSTTRTLRSAQHRLFSATDSATPSSQEQQYVHPLSQIILEHLQSNQSEFLAKSGFEISNIEYRKDGTFALTFPYETNKSSTSNETESNTINTSNEDGSDERGKIWTSYEVEEKKHWLTVQKGTLVGRYMLQDNMKPAWHSDKKSAPEKVQDAVDAMIKKLSK